MRTLEGSNRVRNGLMGIIILVVVIGVGQSFASVPMLFAKPTYYAQFSDTGGLNTGDNVRIAGVDVGQVRSMDIEGDRVRIGFSLDGTQIGTDSRAAIRTDTILGRRNIEIEPRGTQALRANGTLPLGQTTTPYQIYDAFFDVTKAASGWDTQTVKRSLNVLSETIDQTSPHLSAALDGVARFSDTIGKRDEDIKTLLANANKIAGVLGNRSEQINRLFVNAQSLLAAVNERNYAVSMLLERVSSFSDQVKGFIDDNPNLNHVLEQLHTISDIWCNGSTTSSTCSPRCRSSPHRSVRPSRPDRTSRSWWSTCCRTGSCSPSSTPHSRSAVSTPRSSGVTRVCPRPSSPIRTGPGSPTVLPRRRRDHRRHARESWPRGAEGLAVLVHAAARSPAAARGSTAVFTPDHRSVRRPEYRPAERGDLTTEPERARLHARCAQRGHPGSAAARHARCASPLAPAPPGARTVPLGPQPSPPDFTPGIAPLPPALDGPPPPPGPGPDAGPAGTPPLPGNPPFLPPGSQGG